MLCQAPPPVLFALSAGKQVKRLHQRIIALLRQHDGFTIIRNNPYILKCLFHSSFLNVQFLATPLLLMLAYSLHQS